ncbi:hypothetical protein [Flavobacterium sp. 7E]|uniref:hypothetical protein n=1 Tax=Flavobacterium sp. 7E TaxID=2735898 RepID=UPI00157080E9|nr:hypothetical protein [Flavobacterium sp. 7E]
MKVPAAQSLMTLCFFIFSKVVNEMKVSRLSNQLLNSHNAPAGLGRVKVAFN